MKAHLLLHCLSLFLLYRRMEWGDIPFTRFENYTIHSSYHQIVEKRLQLSRLIDGNAFYNIPSWPKEMTTIFWKKPLQDLDTFKLTLFLLGNGCSPHLTYEWIVTSTFWNKTKTKKRSMQVKWILQTMEENSTKWFYYDLHFEKYLYLNGKERKL